MISRLSTSYSRVGMVVRLQYHIYGDIGTLITTNEHVYQRYYDAAAVLRTRLLVSYVYTRYVCTNDTYEHCYDIITT